MTDATCLVDLTRYEDYRNMTLRYEDHEDTWNRGHLLSVLRRLRPDDMRELNAISDDESPEAHFKRFVLMDPIRIEAMSICAGEWVIGYLGCWRVAPRAGSAGFIATEAFPLIAPALTRWIVRVWIPRLVGMGLRRVEIRALADAHDNCRWLEALGARHECDLPELGKNGETFRQYAFTIGDLPCASRRRVQQAA